MRRVRATDGGRGAGREGGMEGWRDGGREGGGEGGRDFERDWSKSLGSGLFVLVRCFGVHEPLLLAFCFLKVVGGILAQAKNLGL